MQAIEAEHMPTRLWAGRAVRLTLASVVGVMLMTTVAAAATGGRSASTTRVPRPHLATNGQSVGNDPSVHPGSILELPVPAYAHHALVQVQLVGRSAPIEKLHADGHGVADVQFHVPALAPGSYRLSVVGLPSGSRLQATSPGSDHSGTVVATVPQIAFIPFSVPSRPNGRK